MSNSWRTQYVPASIAKDIVHPNAGQWEPEDSIKFPDSKLKRLFRYDEDGKPVYFHGEKINQRHNKSYEATSEGVMLPLEPQQVRMLIGTVPIEKVRAMKGICEFEINSRRCNFEDLV